MSKKELVKSTIDRLMNEGSDFHEITQGTLSLQKELEGVSKTTIKRAKNEYKKEKIVIKSNYKETLIKRKIYKFLDKNPRTTLSELREEMPEIPPGKVSEYHLFWTRKRDKSKKDRAKEKVLVNPRKLKEMVFNYLNSNENATCDQLLTAFPNANKSSVTSYFGHWKKKKANNNKGKEGSLYNVVFRFMDNHPETSIDALKTSFKDVPIKSLEVYHNLWLKKRDEATSENKLEKMNDSSQKSETIKKVSTNRKETPRPPLKVNKSTPKKVSSIIKPKPLKRRDQETESNLQLPKEVIPTESKEIAALLDKIESQKLTLTALEVEHSMLKDSAPASLIEGFTTMSAEEIDDVKEFIVTYMKGLDVGS